MGEGTAKSGSPPNGYHPLPAGFACKCVRVWQDGKGNYWCCRPVAVEMPGSDPGKATHAEFASVQPASADDPGRALWDKMQAEHDEQLSKHSMFQASAAMPSEEIERVFNLAARAMQRRFKASGSEEEIEAALSALFAPILAEKGRDITTLAQRLAHAYEAKHRCNEDANYERARALAVEAALAAERERCAKVAEDHGMLVSNEPIGKACSRNIAAAIRAQGE